jgi:hypothetical protein
MSPVGGMSPARTLMAMKKAASIGIGQRFMRAPVLFPSADYRASALRATGGLLAHRVFRGPQKSKSKRKIRIRKRITSKMRSKSKTNLREPSDPPA